MTANKNFLNAIIRTSFPSFLRRVIATIHPGVPYSDNWHIAAMAHSLSTAEQGKAKRLIFNLPPRTLKSTIISVAWAAFMLGHNPRLRIIVASYGETLAKKFHNDFRAVIKQDWYREAFPEMVKAPSKDDEMAYITAEHGYRLAVTVGGAFTGRGADIIIIDDPIKADDVSSETVRDNTNDWLCNTLFSRLDNPKNGIIILAMQRLHENDPSGFLLERGGYNLLSIPALAPENELPFLLPNGKTYQRQPQEPIQSDYCDYQTLIEKRKEVGSIVFEAQYQQNPTPAAGNYFCKEHFLIRYMPDEIQTIQPFDYVIASWDTASKIGIKNDFSVGTFWGVKPEGYYLLNVIRERCEYPRLLEIVRQTNIDMQVQCCLIEDAGVGTGIIQTLREQSFAIIRGISPKDDKKIRAEIQLGAFESGKIILPADAEWCENYIKEFLAFPNGKHDDQIDSTTQFLAWIKSWSCDEYLGRVAIL